MEAEWVGPITREKTRMRISRHLAAAKESFTKDYFKAHPDASVGKVNEEIRKKFGGMMRIHRVYELRNEARVESGLSPTPVRPRKGSKAQSVAPNGNGNGNGGNLKVVAHRQEQPGPGFSAVLIPIEDESQGAFLKAALAQIEKAGLASVKVDTWKERYAVVTK